MLDYNAQRARRKKVLVPNNGPMLAVTESQREAPLRNPEFDTRFTCFLNLPQELQNKVIKDIANEGRIIEINRNQNERPRGYFPTKISQKAPALLHVCQQWRQEAKRYYVRANFYRCWRRRLYEADTKRAYTWFNPYTDFVYLNGLSPSLIKGFFEEQAFALTRVAVATKHEEPDNAAVEVLGAIRDHRPEDGTPHIQDIFLVVDSMLWRNETLREVGSSSTKNEPGKKTTPRLQIDQNFQFRPALHDGHSKAVKLFLRKFTSEFGNTTDPNQPSYIPSGPWGVSSKHLPNICEVSLIPVAPPTKLEEKYEVMTLNPRVQSLLRSQACKAIVAELENETKCRLFVSPVEGIFCSTIELGFLGPVDAIAKCKGILVEMFGPLGIDTKHTLQDNPEDVDGIESEEEISYDSRDERYHYTPAKNGNALKIWFVCVSTYLRELRSKIGRGMRRSCNTLMRRKGNGSGEMKTIGEAWGF